MILVENCVINSEGNEVSEASKMSNLTGVKTETNLPNQSEVVLSQDLNGRFDGDGPAPVCNYTCHNDGHSGEVSQLSAIDSDGISLNADPAATTKNANRENDITLEDMYNARYNFDEDDDDSDWEPSEKQIEVLKWFCVNCTMVNVEDIGNCEVCGEHRESGILRHGFFASPYLPVEDVNQEELPVTENSEDSCKQSSLSSSTAVGLDERMLLHAEVVMKSHPHPERPDRLRAIAAILATAGIFPAKCYSIPAREICRNYKGRTPDGPLWRILKPLISPGVCLPVILHLIHMQMNIQHVLSGSQQVYVLTLLQQFTLDVSKMVLLWFVPLATMLV